jgi:predicted DNA-binding transcriptional regulator AlpA
MKTPDGMLRKQQVADLLGVTPRAIVGMVARGAFPAPIAFSSQNKAWPESVVRAWLASKGAKCPPSS